MKVLEPQKGSHLTGGLDMVSKQAALRDSSYHSECDPIVSVLPVVNPVCHLFHQWLVISEVKHEY